MSLARWRHFITASGSDCVYRAGST